MLHKSSDGAGFGPGGSRHMRLPKGTEGAGHEALSVPCRHDSTLHMEQRKSVACIVPLRGM